MLTMIEERIRFSGIQVERRDVMIRLRAMIEDDLMAAETDGASTVPSMR